MGEFRECRLADLGKSAMNKNYKQGAVGDGRLRPR